MKKLITFILISFCGSFILAQNSSNDYYNYPNSRLLSKERVSASFSAGAGVCFIGSSKNTAFTSFIAPKIGYQLNNKFKLNVGLMHYSITGNTFIPINKNEAFTNSGNRTRLGNLLFVEGQYDLNKRVSLTGSVMYDANNFSNKQSNYKAVALGLDYKVSKHSSIGFQAIFSQGESPYYNSHNGSYNFGGQSPIFNSFGGLGQDLTQRLNSAIR
ncbi:MAG: hypothetical protein NTX97_12585 [Bacteroidetes bacterium]|nr:hypothetical protein [Bacteroidota bacterium]